MDDNDLMKLKLLIKAILITGLLISAILAMYLQFEQIANVIFGGLIGYLSKDAVDTYLSNITNE